MPDTISREEQLATTHDLLSLATELGYGEAEFEVTRGGTLKVKVKRGEQQAAGHQWGTGRKR